MDQHSIPRQITTFEFKLIGFMTLRQFIYLVVFLPFGYVVYMLFPVPIVNIVLGIIVGLVGMALAFFPINERPLDVWIKNMLKSLTSSTQYTYHKNNQPIFLLQDLVFTSDPHRTSAHIESQKKLNNYLNKNKPEEEKQKRPPLQIFSVTKKPREKSTQIQTQRSDAPQIGEKKIFLAGSIKNNKKISLPGVLVYVKDQGGTTIRLLKTNPHGVFATYSPIQPGEYLFEVKDPNGTYFFDTMKIKIEADNPRPLEFCSKEIL